MAKRQIFNGRLGQFMGLVCLLCSVANSIGISNVNGIETKTE